MNIDQIKDEAMEFFRQVVEGDFNGAVGRFDTAMTEAMPVARLEDSWRQLIGQFGAFQRATGSRTTERNGYQIVTLTCQFGGGVLEIDLSVNENGQIAGLFIRPGSNETTYNAPAYVDRAAFGEVELTVGSGMWAVPATLSLPEGDGPFPAVVLVHGSGPLDRDESIGPNKIFRDIAWGLASQGIAVLRYEKRTKAHASRLTGDLAATMTVKEEVIDDALSAVDLMRGAPQIDSRRIYLLGHSLGATLAPRIAELDRSIAGLIILAGMTRPLEDTILDQVSYLYGLAGEMSEAQVAQLDELKMKVARVKDPDLSDRVPASELPLDLPAAYWLSLRGYEPAQLAASLAMPIFVLQGGRDYQVTVKGDFPAWQRALGESATARLEVYPALSHGFIAGEGPSTPQEYLVESHVSEEVIRDICGWITVQARD